MRLKELTESDITRLLRIVDSENFARDHSAIDIWYAWATEVPASRPSRGLFGTRLDMDNLMKGWEKDIVS